MDDLPKTVKIAAYLDAIDHARRAGYRWRAIHAKLREAVGVEDAEIFRQLVARARKAVADDLYSPEQLPLPGDGPQAAAQPSRPAPAARQSAAARPAARPAAAPVQKKPVGLPEYKPKPIPDDGKPQIVKTL